MENEKDTSTVCQRSFSLTHRACMARRRPEQCQNIYVYVYITFLAMDFSYIRAENNRLEIGWRKLTERVYHLPIKSLASLASNKPHSMSMLNFFPFIFYLSVLLTHSLLTHCPRATSHFIPQFSFSRLPLQKSFFNESSYCNFFFFFFRQLNV